LETIKKSIVWINVVNCDNGLCSFSFIDWDIIVKGKGIDIYNQIDLPIIFFVLSTSLMIPNVNKLKEDKELE